MSYYLKYLKYKEKYLKKKKDLQIGGSSQNCVYNDEDDIMENECPGLKYFNEIKHRIDKNPDAIYMMFGHGCDLDGELLTVPANCRYITRGMCGIVTWSDVDIDVGIDFLNNTLDIRRFDKYEWVTEEPEVNAIYFEEYKTHVSGQKYVNNKNSCFLDKSHGHGGLSGLRRLGDHVSKPEVINVTLREYLVMCYEGSLYPTTEQINKLLNESTISNSFEKLERRDSINLENLKEWGELITNNFSIDYASIMDILPGTFINKACRPICKGKKTKNDYIGTTEFIQLARTNSDRKIYINPPKEILDKMNKYPGEESHIPISYLKEDLSKLD